MPSFLRIWAVIIATLREILFHNRWFQLSLIGSIVLVVGIQSVAQLPLGSSSAKLIYDLGLGAVLLSLGCILVVCLVSVLNDDERSEALAIYLTRELRRSEYLLGKLVGCWLSVALAALIAVGTLGLLVGKEVSDLAAEGIMLNVPGIWGWIQVFTCLLQQWLVLGTLVLLLTVLSRTFLLPVVLSLLVWLLSSFSSAVNGWSEESAGISESVFNILQIVLPRFEFGNVANELWYAGSVGTGGWFIQLGSGLLYGVLLFLASAFVFARKEL